MCAPKITKTVVSLEISYITVYYHFPAEKTLKRDEKGKAKKAKQSCDSPTNDQLVIIGNMLDMWRKAPCQHPGTPMSTRNIHGELDSWETCWRSISWSSRGGGVNRIGLSRTTASNFASLVISLELKAMKKKYCQSNSELTGHSHTSPKLSLRTVPCMRCIQCTKRTSSKFRHPFSKLTMATNVIPPMWHSVYMGDRVC